jgi:hypothetical protein
MQLTGRQLQRWWLLTTLEPPLLPMM